MDSGTCNRLLETFKQRVQDNFMQEWHARLQNFTRARYYLNIATFKNQVYLDIVNVKNFNKVYRA